MMSKKKIVAAILLATTMNAPCLQAAKKKTEKKGYTKREKKLVVGAGLLGCISLGLYYKNWKLDSEKRRLEKFRIGVIIQNVTSREDYSYMNAKTPQAVVESMKEHPQSVSVMIEDADKEYIDLYNSGHGIKTDTVTVN